jgi:hypothetical protein
MTTNYPNLTDQDRMEVVGMIAQLAVYMSLNKPKGIFLVSGCSTAANGEVVDYTEVHTPNGTVPCVVTNHGVSCNWNVNE